VACGWVVWALPSSAPVLVVVRVRRRRRRLLLERRRRRRRPGRGGRCAGELRADLGEGGEDGGVVARRVEGEQAPEHAAEAVPVAQPHLHHHLHRAVPEVGGSARGSDDSFSTATPTPAPSAASLPPPVDFSCLFFFLAFLLAFSCCELLPGGAPARAGDAGRCLVSGDGGA